MSGLQLGADNQLGVTKSAPATMTTTTASTNVAANTSTTATIGASTSTTTTFNTKATEFVPKGKMVKTAESFPTLD
jgi:hypothetical protein